MELSKTPLHSLADGPCSGQAPPEQPQGTRGCSSLPGPLLRWIKPLSRESAPTGGTTTLEEHQES